MIASVDNTLILGKTSHFIRRRETHGKKNEPAFSASLLTVKVACLQNDLGRSLNSSIASWRSASQQRKYPFFCLNRQNNSPKHLGHRPHHGDPSLHFLCLFLYFSSKRNTPLSKQCSPDAQKHHKLE